MDSDILDRDALITEIGRGQFGRFVEMRRALAQVADSRIHAVEGTGNLLLRSQGLSVIANQPTQLIHGPPRRFRLCKHIGKGGADNPYVPSQLP